MVDRRAPSPVSIVNVTVANADRFGEGIGRVYERVWKTDPDQTEGFLERAFARHLRYAEFAGLVAVTPDGAVVGFTYGYRSEPGGWWHELVHPALAANDADEWLDDAFEFVELAVDPAWHGLGYGGQLHDTLLRDRDERVALLSTAEGETPAQAMYRKRGWISLVEGFQYLPGGEPCSLLGLDLAAFRKR
ncbi:MAG: GNAT family N-acetyltransferase [Thermomicrobiales bacterium]